MIKQNDLRVDGALRCASLESKKQIIGFLRTLPKEKQREILATPRREKETDEDYVARITYLACFGVTQEEVSGAQVRSTPPPPDRRVTPADVESRREKRAKIAAIITACILGASVLVMPAEYRNASHVWAAAFLTGLIYLLFRFPKAFLLTAAILTLVFVLICAVVGSMDSQSILVGCIITLALAAGYLLVCYLEPKR